MNDKLGTVAYDERGEGGQYLGMQNYREKNYSEATAETIDKEVRHLLEEAHAKAKEIIELHRDKVQLMTEMLMEFETLDREDVLEIMNDQWDIEKKKERIKLEQNLRRATPPAPPEKTSGRDLPPSISENPSPQQT